MKNVLLKFYWILHAQFGVNPSRFLKALLGLARYARDFLKFRKKYKGKLDLLPCLHDWFEEGGATKSEYFWQDLLVARMIFDAKPEKHVDIGSRVDGFVAHVASYRNIEVLDIRPISNEVPGVLFTQADLMQPLDSNKLDYCDSLSCLHALEHFGLGRYGDPIDPYGFDRGLENLAKLLKTNGLLYLAVPIGQERVEFNGQRVSDPRHIVKFCDGHGLTWKSMIVVGSRGELEFIEPHVARLNDLAARRYSLGIFTFAKNKNIPI